MPPDLNSQNLLHGWNFDNSYAQLPPSLFTRQQPTAVKSPAIVLFNERLATELGLNAAALANASCAGVFAGNRVPEGADPIAQAYAGHQYGNFTRLGDGRAILLGEHLTPSGKRLDIQLKGSGPTTYSRRGDGRATLGPMLREYVISEAMHALGVPTTRCLAVASTGEDVARDRLLPGAVLTRVAASHIRVGTFEFAARFSNAETLEALTRYTLARHFPEVPSGQKHFALPLLDAVIEGQAQLIARWLLLGFVHGVMNTDNMALSGDTIDYGPCAFLDVYDAATVFSSIDQQGRYAYGNQPQIAQWNLARFAETLLPLIDPDEKRAVELASERIDGFGALFRNHWLAGMRRKLGLLREDTSDPDLIQDLLEGMQASSADYTGTFRALSEQKPVETTLSKHPGFHSWITRWKSRLEEQDGDPASPFERMKRENPVFIPRNHQVEVALDAAVDGDMAPIHRLLKVISAPFDDQPNWEEYKLPPPSGSPPYRTFCGT